MMIDSTKAQTHQQARVAELYERVLASGQAGVEAYYQALRQRGIEPVPVNGVGDLYASNPVLVPAYVVEQMVIDVNRFCQARYETLGNAQTLLDCMPAEVQNTFASREVAQLIYSNLAHRHPLTNLDGYLEMHSGNLQPAYLEWQTVGSYATLGRRVRSAIAVAWPFLAEYATIPSWVDNRLRTLYTETIADDPRRGVVIDYRPASQVTRREFSAIQELTGGPERGLGILDPREVFYHNGLPLYRRDGQEIPIRLAYSRLIHSEMVNKLLPECSAEERQTLHRFFGDGEHILWVSHPLHYYYGTKADFAEFYALGLSPCLPAAELLTLERIAALRAKGIERLVGWVQKDPKGAGGSAVLDDPSVDDLEAGCLLQRTIHPAACHHTIYGSHVPEVRVMGFPAADGRLVSPLIFTRVKAVNVFKSNAGITAAHNIPGTGEGYGLIIA